MSERMDRGAGPSLADALDVAIRDNALTLVAAPSGYGRSAAVGHWARRRPGTTRIRVAGVGSDTEQIARAIAQVAADAGLPPAAHGVQGLLAATLTRARQPLVLILDDAHLLDWAVVDRGLCSDGVLGSGLLRIVLVGAPRLAGDYARHLVAGEATLLDQRFLAGADPEPGDWPVPDRTRGPEISARILRGLTLELRGFVWQTAFAPLVDGPLAQRITGSGDAPVLLSRCVAAGLPLAPAPCRDGVERLRWAPAFAAACRAEASAADPDRARAAAEAAVAALVEVDALTAATIATRYGLANRAAEILAHGWMDLLLSGAEVGLEAACRSLPAGLGDRADICRIVAACQALRGEAPAAGSGLPARRGDPTAYAALLLAGDAAEMEAALAEASAGLDMVADTGNRVHAGYLVGWATARLRPGTARGDGLLLAVAQEARARGSATLAEHARLALAIDDVAAGRFDEATAALAAAQNAPGAAPGAWTAARLRDGALAGAQMKLWRGRHLEAMDEAAAVSAHPDAGLETRSRAQLLVGLAAVDSERWELLATGWRALDSLPTAPSKGEEAVLLRALLCLADGRRAKATALVEPLARTSESAVILARVARVLRQAGRPGLAREAGKRALALPAPPPGRAAALVAMALLEIDAGRAGEGSRQLASAIEWAAPGSAWAPFLAFDPTLAHALAGLAGSGAPAAALGEILARRGGVEETAGLTPRELQIMGLLRTPMTLVEIGTLLEVAPSTVKTHTRSIYRKVGVRDRRELIGEPAR